MKKGALLFIMATVISLPGVANDIILSKNNTNADLSYKGQPVICGMHTSPGATVTTVNPTPNTVLFSFSADSYNGETTLFDSIPGFKQGMAIWRYKPWNAWTKPIPVAAPGDMPQWDVQFFYWQYDNGLYGAAVPLCDKGYRSTIGSENGKFSVRTLSYAPNGNRENVAQFIVGFGRDFYALTETLYREGMKAIGEEQNLVAEKKFPSQFEYLGWCSYNALDDGKKLDEWHLKDALKTYHDEGIKFRWVVIDDGYEDVTRGMLNSFRPNKDKFPSGLKNLTDELKSKYGVRDVGIWMAFNGYWNGINPESELGRKYAAELFSWREKHRPDDSDDAPKETYWFFAPGLPAMADYYDARTKFFKDEGFSFVKVDNQLVTERMAVGNYPIGYLSKQMHEKLNDAVFKYFDGGIINCMDMTAEAYQYFGRSAVARSVEDYFPVANRGTGYNMERGGAAAHLVMALYNNLYFSQMVYTDMDMFESDNPDGVFHAIARALNNGPIYLTDKPGATVKSVVGPLCYSDGKLIRPRTPLMLTEDCLFTCQKPYPVKAFTRNKYGCALVAFNMSDCDSVSGTMAPSDIPGMTGTDFVAYDYFTGKATALSAGQRIPVTLGRMGYKLLHLVERKTPCTPIGLLDKYNVCGTVIDVKLTGNSAEVTVGDGGRFGAYMTKKPRKVLADGKAADFSLTDGLLTVAIPESGQRREHLVSISW